MTSRPSSPPHDDGQGARAPQLVWVDPDLPGPSGGSLYNDRVVDALRGLGTIVHRLRAPGSWPHPEESSRHQLHDQLLEIRRDLGPLPVVVDGLVGGCMPELFAGAPTSRRSRPAASAEVLLVHLPLAAEHEHPGRPVGGSDGPARQADPLAQLEGEAVRAAPCVAATSRWAAEDLRRRHGRQEVDVVVPGVATSPAGLSSDAGGARGPLRLTMAASFTPRKNHRLLGEALSTLLDHDWILQLAGGGAEQAHGREALEDLRRRLPGRVVHHGALPPEEMPELWRRTDLLLLPSWAETYGMVVTEACAHGVPGIVSSGTGAVEALGDAGAAADPAQPAEWARLLGSWLTDPRLRGRWAEAARARADSLPSWEQTANRWQRLIGSLRTG